MDKNEVDKFCRPTFSRNLYMRDNVASVQIPTEFLEKIKEEVPYTAILRGPFGCSWPVEVRQEKNGIFLVDGWENFRMHHFLLSVSFLLFTYCGNWCFEVEIFVDSGLEKEIVDAGVNKEVRPSDVKNKRGKRGKRSVSSLKENPPKSCLPGSEIFADSGLEKETVGAGVNKEAGRSGVKRKRGRQDIFADSGLEKEIVGVGVNKEAGHSGAKSKKGRRSKRGVSSLKDHLPKSCSPDSDIFVNSGLDKEIVGAGVNTEAGPSDVKNKRGRQGKRSVSSPKDHLPKSRCPSSDVFADSGLEEGIVGARVNMEAGPSGVKSKRGRRGKRKVSFQKDHLPKSRWPSTGPRYRTRLTWRPELLSLYLDSCLEEAAKERCASGNLTPESWQKVLSVLKEKTDIDFTPMQLLNKWNSLRRNYIVWSEITEAKKGGNEEYIKVNPLAIDLCEKSLAFPGKMKRLFGCYVSAREDGVDACEERC